MHPCFQEIFATTGQHTYLTYEGTWQNKRWLDGVLKTPEGGVYAHVENGVPLFVPPDQDPWGDDDAVARELASYNVNRETLIPNNWQDALSRWQQTKEEDRAWVQRVAAHGGLALIIACGPAGSHAPALLDLDPDIKLLMSDIGKWVVQDWQKLADSHKMWPFLSCAQFDARSFPLQSNCLDCVDSTGAMSEIYDSFLAVQEAFRALKPGGSLFLSEGMLDPECIQEFPEAGRQALRKIEFDTGTGYQEQLEEAGFDIVSYKQWGPRVPNLGRSTLADIAAKYGVQIRMISVEAEGRKP